MNFLHHHWKRVHCVNISSDYAKKVFQTLQPQILLTSQPWRRSNIAFITNTLQMGWRKIFLQGKLFQREKAKRIF